MLKVVFYLPLSFFFIGCASKKTKQDEGVSISLVPMSFDPQGSDSKKIEGLSTIYFDFSKSPLKQKERELLVKNVGWLKAQSSVSVQIEGHCDNRDSIEYNLALGERRAKAVHDYLTNLGVSPKQLSTISFGKEKPLTKHDSEESHAGNRRDNFVPSQAK